MNTPRTSPPIKLINRWRVAGDQRSPYEAPAIIFEGRLEAHAGTPIPPFQYGIGKRRW